MHGEPKYAAGFDHFDYVNPTAPRQGTLTLAVTGSFDSVNPLIVRGVSAAGVRAHVYESLMERSLDEPFSLYGLIAETMETPPDRSWAAFTLRPQARFSDGAAITVDDVIFSLETLRDHGRPNHRYYYSKIVSIERPDERTVKFVFGPDGDREMPLILGLMPILPKHLLEGTDFEATTLDPPIGSGPYRVETVDVGTRIVYRRNRDHWARDLAPNVGRHNFETITYDYYRDATSAFEAFKKGLYDIRQEGDPTRWATGYDFDAVKTGAVVLEEFQTGLPSGMSAFAFNTRRPVFESPLVRQALIHAFDFEWVNQSLFHGLYERTSSFFDNSELSSHGRPADGRERAWLEAFPGVVAPDILEGTYTMPASDGSGRNRQNWRTATDLLAQAGYEVRGGVMVDSDTGTPLEFELLVDSREEERLALHFGRGLERIGIKLDVRVIDSSQMQRRRQTYDFDMISYTWFASLSPGNEQSFYWGSSGRTVEGTRNYMGAAEPAIDAMIAHLLAAEERPEFVSAARALDRVLLSGHYVVPLFHSSRQWTARRSDLRHPDATSLYGYQLDTWWRSSNQ